jgi:tRNA nucleotidyltransferase (CCA-adding enzyme)
MSIEEDVLKRIKPSDEEAAAIIRIAEDLGRLVRGYIADHGYDIKVKFVGSVAKGTFLSDPDIDLFLMFPITFPKDEMERIGLEIGEELIKGQKLYAEHPYTRGIYHGLDVDMVPCYEIASTENLLTPVDRTPFHTDFVLSRTNPEIKDQIRLMKKFMKGIGAYGAEPNTRGFSGYMCELIVINYGSFAAAVRAASEWREGITIAVDKKGPPMVAPIIMYDPVDPKRNVASAVHIDTFAEFIVACRAYLASPSMKFFFPSERRPLPTDELKRKTEVHGSKLLTVIFDRPEINEDNLHSQIWKTEYALEKKLDTFSFNVLRAVHEMDDSKVIIVYELERDLLSKTYRHIGPPVWVKSSETFLEKWKGNEYGDAFVEDGHWTIVAERMYFTAAEMLTDEAPMAGIGREMDPKTMKILDNEATLKGTDPTLLTELLDPKHDWEI